MPKNIGFTKKQAERVAKYFNSKHGLWEFYAQKEENFKSPTYQWLVICQRNRSVKR